MLSYLGVMDTVVPSDPNNMPLAFHIEGFQVVLGVSGK